MDNKLHIFSAGVARKLVEAVIQEWNASHPDLTAELTVDGSVDLIRKCLSGAPCDLLISADDKIIESMMLPEHARGYVVFAGNRIVAAANPGYDIHTETWKEALLAPDATFDHHNPYADPGGYRAIMSILLADNIEPGLSERLMNHPGHYGMGKDPDPLPEIKYCFDYYTRAASRKAPIAELPDIMNLSRDDLAAEYAKVSFAVDENQTVTATPICHALTIPVTATHPEAAREFAKRFLQTDFAKHGFIERRQIVGESVLD